MKRFLIVLAMVLMVALVLPSAVLADDGTSMRVDGYQLGQWFPHVGSLNPITADEAALNPYAIEASYVVGYGKTGILYYETKAYWYPNCNALMAAERLYSSKVNNAAQVYPYMRDTNCCYCGFDTCGGSGEGFLVVNCK